jgi:hypothetical protein
MPDATRGQSLVEERVKFCLLLGGHWIDLAKPGRRFALKFDGVVSVAPAPASSWLRAASQPKISRAVLGSAPAPYQLRLRLSSQTELRADQLSRLYLLLVVTYYSSYNMLVWLISWVAK